METGRKPMVRASRASRVLLVWSLCLWSACDGEASSQADGSGAGVSADEQGEESGPGASDEVNPEAPVLSASDTWVSPTDARIRHVGRWDLSAPEASSAAFWIAAFCRSA